MLLANARVNIDLMFASLIALGPLTVVLHKLVAILADYLTSYARGH